MGKVVHNTAGVYVHWRLILPCTVFPKGAGPAVDTYKNAISHFLDTQKYVHFDPQNCQDNLHISINKGSHDLQKQGISYSFWKQFYPTYINNGREESFCTLFMTSQTSRVITWPQFLFRESLVRPVITKVCVLHYAFLSFTTEFLQGRTFA